MKKTNMMKIDDIFWSPIQKLMLDVVLPYQADILDDKVEGAEKSHALQNFRIAAKEAEGEFYGMVFQDSDVAKWLEAVAYALTIKPNQDLEQQADDIIALIGRAQEADGYLNTFFTVKEPEHKWQNLLECHELYCSGHMIEAAVAYFEATGKDTFLNIMRRNADLICSRFGNDNGKIRGIPGHQEIELALYRLYKVTGEEEYLKTAKYFLDERGKDPSYFEEELKSRDWYHWGNKPENREYAQNHLPVREQTQAVGHAVRAVYMYTAMAAVANETGDNELINACRTLWNNITTKRMYITGGIGATRVGEAFSIDYNLPSDTVYAETCASVAMVFFAQKMLEIEPKGEYADIMEKELYNTVLSGMQLDGKAFFYVNPLEVVPELSGVISEYTHALPKRPKWYGCACCPPNVARLITSLGQYVWSENKEKNIIFAHLYIKGLVEFELAGGEVVQIECNTNYPWDGSIKYEIKLTNLKSDTAEFTLAIRIPSWSLKTRLVLGEEIIIPVIKDGYAYISHNWQTGDEIDLSLDMSPRRVYANTKVRDVAGCVAIKRGPMVYCFEECDNGADLSALRLPISSLVAEDMENNSTIGNIVTISAQGIRLKSDDELYSFNPPDEKEVKLKAVPYYVWGNREPGGMRVWLLENKG